MIRVGNLDVDNGGGAQAVEAELSQIFSPFGMVSENRVRLSQAHSERLFPPAFVID